MANYQLGFVDIETVSQFKTWEEVPERQDELYQKKFGHELKENGGSFDGTIAEHYEKKAALYAEFGKIVCIVIGYVDQDNKLKLKTLCGRHEKPLLTEAASILSKFNSLAAHNGKSFDYPYMCRRMIINGVSIPQVLNIAGKKPWEINLEDTMEFWRFGDFKYTCSLDLLANCLGLPSPKQDMSGADVGKVYYSMFDGVQGDELPFDAEANTIQKIGKYCQLDVVVLANVYRKLKGQEIIADENIIYS